MQPEAWIDLYIEEDLGTVGDVTSDSLLAPEVPGQARIVARRHGFIVGIPWAIKVFERFGCIATPRIDDATWVDPGTAVLDVHGPARGILAAERLALNMLGRMSGIGTTTRILVERLAADCAGTRVAATRKTTPGFRFFEKEAVRLAGGDPHRSGLWDAAMVKDNHREAAGSVQEAVERIQAAHPTIPVTVEVETLDDALLAASAGAQWLLIDNQDPDTGRQWAETVWAAHPDIKIEASGGIRPDNMTKYGWADRISMGALTQDVAALDLSLEWGPTP